MNYELLGHLITGEIDYVYNKLYESNICPELKFSFQSDDDISCSIPKQTYDLFQPEMNGLYSYMHSKFIESGLKHSLNDKPEDTYSTYEIEFNTQAKFYNVIAFKLIFSKTRNVVLFEIKPDKNLITEESELFKLICQLHSKLIDEYHKLQKEYSTLLFPRKHYDYAKCIDVRTDTNPVSLQEACFPIYNPEMAKLVTNFVSKVLIEHMEFLQNYLNENSRIPVEIEVHKITAF